MLSYVPWINRHQWLPSDQVKLPAPIYFWECRSWADIENEEDLYLATYPQSNGVALSIKSTYIANIVDISTNPTPMCSPPSLPQTKLTYLTRSSTKIIYMAMVCFLPLFCNTNNDAIDRNFDSSQLTIQCCGNVVTTLVPTLSQCRTQCCGDIHL